MTDPVDQLKHALAGRYAIERELGAGGMATVYLAEDVKHQRKVAVKVLRPELAAALGHDRFLREITTTANLRHPHILPLYDSGEAADLLFYVMPYVEGETLRDRLDREKQLPLEEALQIAREVADALSYAHSRGVIHRDIKPDNILLESGHAVVADFGIARAVDAAGGDKLTQTGVSVGTPTYMSPEQAAGQQDLDGRSDLYALACVLYEMLAGQPPFTGPTVESVVHQHLTADPRPITQIRPAVPGDVAGVLQRALAKNPADRFNPVAQFSDALRPGVATSGFPTTDQTAPPSRRWLPWVAAAAIVVIAIVFGLRALRDPGSAPASGARDRTSVAVLPFVDLSGGANEYLGDGIAETLIHALSNVEGLQVAARTSAFSFKGRQEDVREIGRALGVGSVLEGSVQRSGDRLRITAQLVNASDGFDLWSQTFDRDVEDVFAVQDEVARAVVAALQVELAGSRAGAQVVEEGTANVAAYNAYLQGRFFWDKRTTADMQRAAEFYEDAVALDSSYALAWAGLASTYALFVPAEYDVTTISPGEALDRAERAARRALQLDDQLGEAHTALALVLEKRGLSEQATAAYERAIAANPRFPTAHQWYSTNLLKRARDDEALEQMRIAARLDPLSMVILTELAEVLEAVGRRAEARAAYDRVEDLYPDAPVVNYYFGIHLLMSGEFDRAADQLAKFVIAWTGDSVEARRVAGAIRDPGRRESALRAMADTARAEVRTAVYRTFGDDEEAILAFTQAVERPDFEVIYVPHCLSLFGPDLRADPRVVAAIARFDQRLREKYGGE